MTVTDEHGCITTAEATLTEPATALSASITSQTDVLCHGNSTGEATVTAFDGTPGYTFSWSNGQTLETAGGLSAGPYTVTVTDDHGCTTTAESTITEPATALSASITSQTDVLCHGNATGEATVTALDGTPAYTFSWSNGQTLETAGGLSAGTYTVTVTDDHGCTTTAEATLTEPVTALSASITSQTDVLCHGNATAEATATAFDGTPGYIFSWSNGQTLETAGGLSAGTYTVTVTDDHGCTTTAEATLTEPATALSASITSQTDVLCHGNATGEATVTAFDGTPAYTFSWSNGQTLETAGGLSAGPYTVTVTDDHGCTTTAESTITEPATALSASITSQTDVLCHGNDTGEATVTAFDGTPAYTFSWSNGQTLETAGGLSAGTYTVTVTDDHGCTTTAEATLTEPQAMNLSGSVVNVSCDGVSSGSITTSLSGGTLPYGYFWNNGMTDPVISGLIAGTYTVTVTDDHQCTTVGSWEVLGTGIDIIGNSSACCSSGNESVYNAAIINGAPPFSFQWTVIGGTIKSGSNTDRITVEWSCCGSGTVKLLANNLNGCTFTKTLPVTIVPPPVPVISGPATVEAGQADVQYCAPIFGSHYYTWLVNGGSITSGQGSHRITVTWGSYPVCGCGSVSVTEFGNGCTGTDTYPVAILPGTNVSISGYVSYDNGYGTGLNGVTIQLRNSSNAIVGTAVSASDPDSANGLPGYYAFTNLPHDTYTLHGSYNGTWGGSNATDALIIQLNVIGLYPLSSLRNSAADVNASMTTTALDALYIKLRTIGSLASYPAGDWKISEETVTISGSPVTQDLMALCEGDVNGSYVPAGFKESPLLPVVEDGLITVPVREPFVYNIRSSRAADLGAMTLFLDYDQDHFEVTDVVSPLDGMKYLIRNGRISIAWADTKALRVNAGDPMLSLNMQVRDKLSEPLRVFTIKPGSEFADISARPLVDFTLKMPDVLTPDGSKDLTIYNYPNPFAGITTLDYTLPESGQVKIVLIDPYGKTIRILADQEDKSGSHTLKVDPVVLNLTPGVYFCRIIFNSSTNTLVKVKKMVFTR